MAQMQDIWNLPLPELRKFMESIPGGSIPAKVTQKEQTIAGVPCKVFQPQDTQIHASKGPWHFEDTAPKTAILYFHGGGFCLGIYAPNTAFAANVSKITGIKVIFPNYSLAPEHPYPTALREAQALIREMLIAHPRLIVMGDSSGCALALSALLAIKNAGEALPAALVFITPMLDFAGKGESLSTRARSDPFGMKDPLAITKIYLGSNDPTLPEFSPLYGDLTGMPPILIHAADLDVFWSDAQRLHQMALAAGVSSSFKSWEDMWHVFHMQAQTVPQAAQAMEDIHTYILSIR